MLFSTVKITCFLHMFRVFLSDYSKYFVNYLVCGDKNLYKLNLIEDFIQLILGQKTVLQTFTIDFQK